MGDVLIRNLDAEVLKRLRVSAKANGRSLQAEIHHVLHRASIMHMAETRLSFDAMAQTPWSLDH